MAMIENEAAYNAAIQRNIMNNARKTWRAKNPRHEEIEEAISYGRVSGPFLGYKEGFLGSMAWSFDTFGKLTEAQTAAVLKGIDSREARRAEWAKKNAEENASSEFIGEIGKRVDITLSCYHVVVLEGYYGNSYIHLCKDPDSNIVVYKGNSIDFPSKGETKVVKATIKDHNVREGVKQTIINRPKVLSGDLSENKEV